MDAGVDGVAGAGVDRGGGAAMVGYGAGGVPAAYREPMPMVNASIVAPGSGISRQVLEPGAVADLGRMQHFCEPRLPALPGPLSLVDYEAVLAPCRRSPNR
jgi:hypothetical protein